MVKEMYSKRDKEKKNEVRKGDIRDITRYI